MLAVMHRAANSKYRLKSKEQVGAARHAACSAAVQAGLTLTPRVVVYPPSETGGRRVRVDGEILGTAFSLHDLTVFLERAGLEGWDELDVAGRAEPGLIEWRGGGPDVWGA